MHRVLCITYVTEGTYRGILTFSILYIPTGQSPVQFSNLSPGQHSVKVRPNGTGCVRRIRRTAEFTVF